MSGTKEIPQNSVVPLMQICTGRVTVIDEEAAKVYFYITDSPVGKIKMEQSAHHIKSHIEETPYKVGEMISLLASFFMDIKDLRYINIDYNSQILILGSKTTNGIRLAPIDFPGVDKKDTGARLINEITKSGFSTGKEIASASMFANGSAKLILSKGEGGWRENEAFMYAQNHNNIIAGSPQSMCRDHFGVFYGMTEADRISNAAPSSQKMTKRYFVAEDGMLDGWVSVCDGAYVPFMGPNNNTATHSLTSSKILSFKMVQRGTSRYTIETGKPGAKFHSRRVDLMLMNEVSIPIGAGAITGIPGNLFAEEIGDDGSYVMVANGSGTPVVNMAKYKFEINDGVARMAAATKIILTNGDADDSLNSITIDKSAGISIKTTYGFKVNDKTLLTEDFVQALYKLMPIMFISGSPGSPCVPNPAFKTTMSSMMNIPQSASGPNTGNLNTPATGIIIVPDVRTTI